jgi:hypothetical protein
MRPLLVPTLREQGKEKTGKERARAGRRGEGASDGGMNKQPQAGKRHEGCLRNEWFALGRQPADPPSIGEDRQRCREGTMRQNLDAGFPAAAGMQG